MKIKVDINEPPWLREQVHWLCARRGWIYHEDPFLTDLIIDDQVYIERKTWSDLSSSIQSRHIYNQMNHLQEGQNLTFLLIEGLHEIPSNAHLIPASSILHWVAGVALKWPHIHICFTFSQEQTVGIIEYLAKTLLNPPRVGEFYREGGRKPRTLREQQLYLLQGLPQIGPMRAAAILDGGLSPLEFFLHVSPKSTHWEILNKKEELE